MAAATTAVAAAVAEGVEMPDGALVPRELAGRTTVSSAGALTGKAVPAAAPAAAAAEAAKNLTITAPIVLPLLCKGHFLGPLFSYRLESCHGGDIINEM